MRIQLTALFAAISLAAVIAAPPVKKKPAAKKGTTAKRSSSAKRTSKSGPLAGVTGPRNHQAAPTAERYKEIQQALITKGYLKGEPSGVWDSESTDAMKRFQAEQKLDPSGKINSPSLIGLGLGPQNAPFQTPAPVSPAPAPQ